MLNRTPLSFSAGRLLPRILLLGMLPVIGFTQSFQQEEPGPAPLLAGRGRDKCGYDDILSKAMSKHLGSHFGYGYDSLLVDLQRWALSPFVSIDSLDASTLNRTIWQLTITDTTPHLAPRHTVFIHARTHPVEVQGWWVTNEIINYLLSEDTYSQMMRQHTVFYIIPMLNPDGVELGYNRSNANGVDIESNWAADSVEVEVAALRRRFTELMASEAPLEVALNMHASFDCKRYFVYHHAAWTSVAYAALEQEFIGSVRSYFPSGIEPWNFFVSWTQSTPNYYPESWFWLNHGASVMALTYEDMNCPEAGLFDSTAYAILHGIGDYLGLGVPAFVTSTPLPHSSVLRGNYPNPFNAATLVRYQLAEGSPVHLRVYDLLGHPVTTLVDGYQPAGEHEVRWQPELLPSGIYLLRLQAGTLREVKQCLYLK